MDPANDSSGCRVYFEAGRSKSMTDMENRNSGSSCEICRGQVFTTCPGCGKALCQACARLELIGSGCGSVWPAYYCPACVMDPDINPNAMLREPEPAPQN